MIFLNKSQDLEAITNYHSFVLDYQPCKRSLTRTLASCVKLFEQSGSRAVGMAPAPGWHEVVHCEGARQGDKNKDGRGLFPEILHVPVFMCSFLFS